MDDPTAVTTVRRDWVGDEAAAPGVRAELRRLGRRARRRPDRTLAYALLLTTLAVLAALRHRPVYQSRVVFHVEGSGGEPDRAGRALRDWVVGSVLSDGQLLALVDEHNLYPAINEPRRAVEAIRGDLEVRVLHDGRGSQRLVIAMRGDDARTVQDTVAHLGRLVEEARRHAHPPRHVLALHLTLAQAAGRDAPLFERLTLVLLAGVAAFLIALPLCALGVAAFDPRVYDLDDVRRLGMATLGAIRGFPGDNAGALVARLGHDRMPPS